MKKNKMITLALIACTLWARAFPALKTLYRLLEIGDDVGVKLTLAGVRFLIAGVAILVFYGFGNKAWPILDRGIIRLEVAVLGLFQTSLLYLMFYVGVYNSTGVKSAILSQSSIFLVVILSHFIYHNDKMHRGKVAGLVLGMAGIIVVNISGLSGDEGFFEFSLTGEGFVLMAGLFTTVGTFYAKRLSKRVTPVLLNGWQMTVGGTLLLLVGLFTSKEKLMIDTFAEVAILGYMAFISAGAFTLWFILLQKNKASELAMMKFSIPVLGAVFSAALIEGESFTLYIVAALVMVALGIYQCNKSSV